MSSTEKPGTDLQEMKTARRGLARTLFSWFLILSLLPLVIVGSVEYNNARENIYQSRHEEMSTVSLMLSRQIGDYYDDVIVTMHFRSGQAADFLTEIKELQATEKLPMEELLTSIKYDEVVERYNIKFVDLMRFYGDVIIGDAQGNILYTVGRYSDFGQNLVTGELSDTNFAKSVRKAIKNDERLYSDQEIYLPAGDEKVSFFVMPLVDDRQQPLGFLAAQIWARDDISFILNQNIGINEHVRAYVVGKDKRIRFHPESVMFPDKPLSLEPVNEWLQHFDETGKYIEGHERLSGGDSDHGSGLGDGHNHSHSQGYDGADSETHEDETIGEDGDVENFSSHLFIYQNTDDQKVIGVSRHIRIGGVPMVLISEMNYDRAMAPATQFRDQLFIVIGLTALLVLVISGIITRKITNPVRTMTEWANRVAAGEYSNGEVVHQNNEIGVLSHSFQVMTERLQKVSADNELRSWQQNGVASLNETVRGEQSMAELCRNIVTTLCHYLEIPMGAMYVLAGGRHLQMMGSFALSTRRRIGNTFTLGEGLPGQAALEKQSITVLVPEDYFTIESGLGSGAPNRIFVQPLIYDGDVKGVMEFALLEDLTSRKKAFLDSVVESIAIAINTSQARDRVQELLDKTTQQTEALQKQQEDLRTANEELEHQTNILQESEEELKSQSDELQRANAELEEKSESLFHQKEEIEAKNAEIEESRKQLEQRAQEMEQVSKYKSEFLANMSHELRTPLNSMLILAKMLADNADGHLDEDEQESAQVIHKVGHDLLGLINDILDLSKVEAGKLTFHIEPTSLDGILESMENQFTPLAKDRNLTFEILKKTNTAISLHTDGQRVMQIIKNLLSNAFKFTETGGVKLHVEALPPGPDFVNEQCQQHGAIVLGVQDSGIGIPKEKQGAIFEAFQQADGSTSRKYGGTGLGLSIAREMSQMLGGEMKLFSEEGQGATFSLLLPTITGEMEQIPDSPAHQEESRRESHGQSEQAVEAPVLQVSEGTEVEPDDSEIEDDRDNLNGERPILVVEDDDEFAKVIYRLAKANGNSCLIAGTGKEAIELSQKYHPRAVILDLGLPDIDGKEVLETLRGQKETGDIPVHVISGRDEDAVIKSLREAENYLIKPVSNKQLETLFESLQETGKFENILVVDSDPEVGKQVEQFMQDRCEVVTAGTAAEARKLIKEEKFSSIILELNLPDETGDVLLHSLKEEYGDSLPPVIINTTESIDRERYASLGDASGSMIVKGESSSQERLQDEVCLFLNSVSKPAARRRKPAAKPVAKDDQLKGRKILLVDDDLRNTFALSKGLQRFEMEITIADNGEMALERLDQDPDLELVLMDIMMPVMDGYEAMKRIRAQELFKDLPIIALDCQGYVR